MAYDIRDLENIYEVETTTLFEGVTDFPDEAGRLSRKVTGAQIEAFVGRTGQQGVVETLIDERVQAEAERVDALLAEDVEDLDEDIAEEEARARAEEERLDDGKANKIVSPHSKTLEAAVIGEAIGAVTFDTSRLPAPPLPGMAGTLVFADGSRFEQLQSGVFRYVSAQGVTTELYNPSGGWITGGFDAGGATVASKDRNAGAAWRLSFFFKSGFDLADVYTIAQSAYETASEAADEFMAEDQRNDQQDAAIAALQAKTVDLPAAEGRYVLNIDAAGNASYVPETTAGGKKK
jgi:hypothetical protein